MKIVKYYAKMFGLLLIAIVVGGEIFSDMFYGMIIVGPPFIIFLLYKQIKTFLEYRNEKFVMAIMWGRSDIKLYHRPWCIKAIGQEGNSKVFQNSEEAEIEGYSRCPKCFNNKVL